MIAIPQTFLKVLIIALWTVSWAFGSAAYAADQAALDRINQQWESSVHALNDVNCSSCHQGENSQEFISHPTGESCQTCHEKAVDTFLLGKHGIRLLEGQSPLQPSMARLPMQSDAKDLQMTCNSCHDVHSVKTVPASTDACLTCHSDNHSLNYQNSKHSELFEADRALPRPSDESVSCATCHLPRYSQEAGDGTITHVNHNNTYTLLPRDRMVKEVCMNCHGVEYSYNSIFDDDLVEANFDKAPTQDMETFELVRALEARRTSQE